MIRCDSDTFVMSLKRLQLREQCEEASVWIHIYNNWVRIMELEDSYILAPFSTLNLQKLTFSGHLGAVETSKQLFSPTSFLCSLYIQCVSISYSTHVLYVGMGVELYLQ